MLISTALLLDSIIRNSVCTPAKLPCRRVEGGYEVISDKDVQNFMFILLETDYLQTYEIDYSAKLYVCRYAAHSISKKIRCSECISLIRAQKGECVDDIYFENLQRNRLSTATESVMFLFVHSYVRNFRIYFE
jgi:hypothetical protein